MVIGREVLDGTGGGVLSGTGVVLVGTGLLVIGDVGAVAWFCLAHGCHSSATPVTSASSIAAVSIARAEARRLGGAAGGGRAGIGACWVGADAG